MDHLQEPSPCAVPCAASPADPREARATAPRAALVLGAAVRPGGQPSAALKRRALHGAWLYRSGQVDRIVASGGPPGAAPSEAEVIGALCRCAGVPDAHILLEPFARNTEENILLSLRLIEAEGCALHLLVTDRFHAPRAELIARSHGMFVPSSSPTLASQGRLSLRMARLHAREAAARAVFRLRPTPRN